MIVVKWESKCSENKGLSKSPVLYEGLHVQYSEVRSAKCDKDPYKICVK
jgi:hypothetical protein